MTGYGLPETSAYAWVTVAARFVSGWVTAVVPSPKSNVTVPVGAPAPGGAGATWAMKVTVCPGTDGSGAEFTVVVVEAWPTVWVSVPVEAVKYRSPPYSAVTVYGAADGAA
nr:hypothetical protein [Streptomyces rapamycinicus]